MVRIIWFYIALQQSLGRSRALYTRPLHTGRGPRGVKHEAKRELHGAINCSSAEHSYATVVAGLQAVDATCAAATVPALKWSSCACAEWLTAPWPLVRSGRHTRVRLSLGHLASGDAADAGDMTTTTRVPPLSVDMLPSACLPARHKPRRPARRPHARVVASACTPPARFAGSGSPLTAASAISAPRATHERPACSKCRRRRLIEHDRRR